MPVWVMRLLWKVRGKRIVRLLPIDGDPTWEGILAGCYGGRDGHYVLLAAKMMIETTTDVDQHALGGVIEVPRERVRAVQVL